jgi:predicted DNA-binding transcriptional regulator AlpA
VVAHNNRIVGLGHNNPPEPIEDLLLRPDSPIEIPSDKAAFTIPEFCHWAGIGRTTFYKLAGCGEIPVRKVGKRSIVLILDAVPWIKSLPLASQAICRPPTAKNQKAIPLSPNSRKGVVS